MPRNPKKPKSKFQQHPNGDPNCQVVMMLGPALEILAHWHAAHSTGKPLSSLIAVEEGAKYPDIYIVSDGPARDRFRELFREEFNRDGAKELERIIFGKEQR